MDDKKKYWNALNTSRLVGINALRGIQIENDSADTGRVFSVADLLDVTWQFSTVPEGFEALLPKVDMQYHLVFNDADGNPVGRMVIQSQEDMRRCFYDGDIIPVVVEKYVNGEWVFVAHEAFAISRGDSAEQTL